MNSSLRAANRSLLLSTICVLVFGLGLVIALPDAADSHSLTKSDHAAASNVAVQQSQRRQLTDASEIQTSQNQVDDSIQDQQAVSQSASNSNGVSARTVTQQSNSSTNPRVSKLDFHDATEQYAANDVRRPVANHDPRPTGAELSGTLEPAESEKASQQYVQLFPRRSIRFQTVPVKNSDSATSRLEARLASMETKLTQLAQAQGQPPSSSSSSVLQQLQKSVQQLQQNSQMQKLTIDMMNLAKDRGEGGAAAAAVQPNETQTDTSKPAISTTEIKSGKADNIIGELNFNDSSISDALASLGQFSGKNIVSGKGIEGTVTANLQNVTFEEALNSILRSNDLHYEKDGEFYFVMTREQMEIHKKTQRKIVTRVFLPHYVKSTTLLSLVSPMITKETGFIAANDANEIGIARDAENAGGDNMTQGDALVVRDYEEIVEEVARVVEKMDVPPMQVVIEAMILSVRLTDSMEFGVNFALLNDAQSELFVSGNGATLNGTTGFPTANDQNIIPPSGEFLATTAGMKYGIIRKDVAGFINALESIADTNLVAAPQLRVLNKQKAELIIGDRISYRTLTFNGTQTVENVNFLDVGTKLLLRPFMSSDGLVRMEIHPERSSATIDQATGLPNQTTTEVTTNVMVPNGHTVVIGGLIEEQVSESLEKIPLLGSLPVVGQAFRNKDERIDRTELIVLLTPRIVEESQTAAEGDEARNAYLDRAQNFSNNISPVNRSNLVRIMRERAQLYYDRGDYKKALYFINDALRNGKNDLQSLKLKREIEAALSQRRFKWPNWPPKNEFVRSKTKKNKSPENETFLLPTNAESK